MPAFQILPHDLSSFKGGKELDADISSLSAKVDLFKAELRQQQADGGVNTMTRTENSSIFTDSSEVKRLLRPRFGKKSAAPNPKTGEVDLPPQDQQAGVSINIEEGVLSLNDQEFEKRDRTADPDAAVGEGSA